MKKVIAFTIALGIIALCYCAAAAATNDYIWSQKPASGPLVSRNLTPTVGRIIGFPTSINSPETIIIGSGLTLTGTTLTASGSGTVTSVALSAPSILSVAGSPVTTNGTLALSLATQASNIVFAGPATGADAAPTFRALVAADIPSLSSVYQPLDSDLTALSSATAAGLALMDDADASAQRTTLGLGTLATQNGTIGNYAPLASPTFSGTVTMPSFGLVFPDGGGVIGMEFGGGLNKIMLKTASLSGVKTVTIPATTGTIITTGDTGTVTNNMLAGSIDLTTKVTGALPAANMPALTGDVTTSAGAVATTLATVNSNVGSFTNASVTVNAKGLVTAASSGAVKTEIIIACSDETTAVTTGTGKVTFRMPYAMTVTGVRATTTTANTGGTLLTIDINEAGATILSTKLTLDASETTSTTAATPVVISDTSLADDAVITIDFDAVGSTIAGAGVKVALIGTRQ